LDHPVFAFTVICQNCQTAKVVFFSELQDEEDLEFVAADDFEESDVSDIEVCSVFSWSVLIDISSCIEPAVNPQGYPAGSQI